jgi:hypothetical protein
MLRRGMLKINVDEHTWIFEQRATKSELLCFRAKLVYLKALA